MNEIERLAINAIRFLAVDAIEAAKSGHPGMPLGAAPMAYVLWHDYLKTNPKDPTWPDRDRFVLSAGHASMLLYAILHLTGFDLPLEELKRFRQWGSKTPGHPEYGLTPGVEVTTGPLGQGFGAAVGMALAEKKLAAEFNREGFPVVDHWTYVIASDGDLMEGVSAEAASLAGTWGLGKLIVLWDNNRVSIDGSTDLAFTENVIERFGAYRWQVLTVEDGEDLEAIRHALELARAETERPTLIAVRTHLGFGSPLEDSPKAHGAPLGEEAVRATRERLGWPYPPFEVPEEVYAHFRTVADRGVAAQEAWETLLENYAWKYPEEAAEFVRRVREERLPEGALSGLTEGFRLGERMATRAASGRVLARLAERVPELLGGSADLTPSNNTKAPGMDDFSPENPAGRYLHYGVREHAMGAILNGLVLHRGYLPYAGTFLVFSDYMRPAVRLAALMGIRPIYVWTHDSIALGEDGPTHQPIEHLMSLRAMPRLTVIRPADAFETAWAWRAALTCNEGPVALVLTRQKVANVTGEKAEGLLRGGYVLREASNAKGTLLATGSEVELALAAADRLAEEGLAVRVVSLPSFELFERQDPAYREAVLGPRPRLVVEAGVTLGWERYADAALGIDRFGASAPGPEVYARLGFTPEAVAERFKALLASFAG